MAMTLAPAGHRDLTVALLAAAVVLLYGVLLPLLVLLAV